MIDSPCQRQPLRIALFHNRYAQRGGEDAMVEFEAAELARAGHRVEVFEVSNAEALDGGKLATVKGKAMMAAQAVWNRDSANRVERDLVRFNASIGHVHNWFPLLSPSIYAAHHRAGVPVVQTLHNYRLICANGTCYRDESVCTECLDGRRRRAIRRGCYRGSKLQSAVWWATMQRGWRDAFTKHVDAYVAPSKVVAQMHIDAGLPDSHVHVVPNATHDPGEPGPLPDAPRAVFVGRLEPEKGIHELLDAWCGLPWELHVVGDGSIGAKLRQRYADVRTIVFHGEQPHQQAMLEIQQSSLVVFPSRWLEPFGLGVVEAMARGRAVLTAGRGAPATLNIHGTTGLHVADGQPALLAAAASRMLSRPHDLAAMGRAARRRYLAEYTPEAHVAGLTRLFGQLTETRYEFAA